jgi:NAD(P)-dependent dehydrogenase (short-subunit alcohol dehydrogenase family)
MPGRMEGKVALVTGAARGQGRSHAVRLAQEGADIIAVDLCDQIESVPYAMSTKADLDETVRQIEALDRRVVAAVADVRDKAQLVAAVQTGVAELGHLDVVVANAGIVVTDREAPPGVWLDIVEVNLNGVVNTIAAAYPQLGPGASIVCTGSMAALLPGSVDAAGPGGAGYGHSKRAVARLVHDLAQSLAPGVHTSERGAPRKYQHADAAQRRDVQDVPPGPRAPDPRRGHACVWIHARDAGRDSRAHRYQRGSAVLRF